MATPNQPQDTIRVMLVDEYPVTLKGLTNFLSTAPDIMVIAQITRSVFALPRCRQLRPDVVLIDMGLSDVQTIRLIRTACPDTQVIALRAHVDKSELEGIFRAGAIGFVHKNTTDIELIQAVRLAYQGKSSLAPEAARTLIDMTVLKPPTPSYNLTPREREIIAMLKHGWSNKEIAQHFTISPTTVKNHVANIMEKLEAKGRSHVVALAFEYNIA